MANLWIWIIYGYGWWFFPTPLKKYEFVNWDDDIPNGNIKFMFQTTNQLSTESYGFQDPEISTFEDTIWLGVDCLNGQNAVYLWMLEIQWRQMSKFN